jgi:predicted SnoaL-like aldol condensation-catalyzing enzyme
MIRATSTRSTASSTNRPGLPTATLLAALALAAPWPAIAFGGVGDGGQRMSQTIEEKNKTLVLEAFDTLFNKRDYVAAERYWSPAYIQHSAHIEPGRDGLFNLIKSIPPTLKYEPGEIVAGGDLVIVHGRFSGMGLPVNWIAADIVRIKDGVLVEHWDVIEDEATRESSKSGRPMFGDKFPPAAGLSPRPVSP